MGRTHGIHAEPTTFGLKLAGFAFEARPQPAPARARRRGRVGRARCRGAVGTYASNGPEFEEVVLRGSGLAREDVSTQVVARDRHAELL